MVLKLVNVNQEKPSKRKLPHGKFTIGRGKLLLEETSDCRISRNHAEVEVTNNSLCIKSLHENPCFYTFKDTTSMQLLKQGDNVTLRNGDKFGILPNEYWYEIIYCVDDDVDTEPTVDNVQIEAGDGGNQNTDPPEDLDDNHLNETVQDIGIPENMESSPSLIAPNNESTEDYQIADEPPPTESEVSKSPVKRPLTPEFSTLEKKVKVEKNDNEAGSNNNNQVPSNSTSNDADTNKGTAPASLQKPGPVLRERCIYGANCYRRNPQHKAQFSHPSDADWGSGPKGQCPYGARCQRRDQRHWLVHDHPPGVAPPAPNVPGMRRVERHGNIFYINAHAVNFYDDHFEVTDSDGESIDYDYEF